MKVIEEGHRYEVDSLDGTYPQIIQFIMKLPIDEGSSLLGTVIDGTTNEELMKVLIDRLNYLNAKMPCKANIIAIQKLQEALMWQEYRTSKRKAQGIESTNIPHTDVIV